MEIGGVIEAGCVLDADDRAERADRGENQERRLRADARQHGGEDRRAADQESDRARRQGAQHDRATDQSAVGEFAERRAAHSSTAKTKELNPPAAASSYGSRVGSTSDSAQADTKSRAGSRSSSSRKYSPPISTGPGAGGLFANNKNGAVDISTAPAKLVSRGDEIEFGIFGMRTVIGRSKEAADKLDIDLKKLAHGGERVSRRHAEIVLRGGGLFYSRSRQPERHLCRGAREARARPALQIEGSRPGGARWCYIAVSKRLAAHDQCPECGQEAPDDAKFCDRCGRGLSKTASPVAQSSPTRPTPLAAGASLKNGIEIVALTSQTSIENRYSAKRVRDGKTESIALRERFGPHPAEEVVEEAPVVETPEPAPARAEDPNGPSAKTAELKPLPAQTNGTASPAAQPHASSASSFGAARSAEGIQSAVEADASPAAADWPRLRRTRRQMKRAKRRKPQS